MWDAIREKKFGVRILLGVFLGAISISMLLYLVPQQTGSEITGADVVAQVGNQTITTSDVQTQLNRISRNGQIPRSILPLYARQSLDQLIFERSLELEAERLGMRVTDEEHANLLRKIVPTAFAGDTFIGMDKYTNEVQARFQMSVPEFESEIKKELLQEKFQQLVTDGITVTDDEVRAEYLRANEKIKLDYVLIKPDGWTLDAGAAAVNGLTVERLLADGIPVAAALLEYTKAIETGRVVLAFNAVFDTKVMRGELRRAGMDDMFMKTRNICVMRAMTDICQIPYANDRAGFKFPKLAEALAHIGEMPVTEGAHTAMVDALGALAIARWLRTNQMLPEPGIHLAKKRPDLVPTRPRRSAGKAPPAAATDELPA